jgi:uroporphyrinogen-III decarboxylase
MDSWLKLKGMYEFSPERLEATWDAPHDPDALIVAFMPGGFDEPRQLMGEEGLCVALYEDPELVHDMLDTIGTMAERTLDIVSQKVRIDQLSIHEDMAGKSGPLMGPAHIIEFIKPYYRRVWDMLESRGATIFAQDSDGDMNAIIPAFLDAGINHMYPFEPAAGMDVVEARKTYGKALSARGGIDKHVLRQDQAAIRKELEYKLQPMMREGGIAFGLDHRIPNGTTIENYRYYVRTAKEILGLDPDGPRGWGRTAF